MQGKDYWNIFTRNAKRVTSPWEFRRCCAADLLRDIGTFSFYFAMSPETQRV